jgi:YjbR
LPEVTERVSHGDPAFFVGKKCFVMFRNNHHGVGWLALWCASSITFQAAMIERESQNYFVPPYVGHRGWLGVKLDGGLTSGTILNHLLEAYCCVAPSRLQDKLEG